MLDERSDEHEKWRAKNAHHYADFRRSIVTGKIYIS